MAVESDVLALFRRFAELPTFSAGSLSINGDVMTVSTTLSVATHSSSAFERETHVQTHTLVTEPKLKLLASSTPIPLGKDVLHQSISPSGRRSAVFRKLTKEGKGLRLAVFEGSVKLAEAELAANHFEALLANSRSKCSRRSR